MKKYLVVGSAPYAKEYINEVLDKYLEEGFLICPLNNAWSIFQNNLEMIHRWFVPQDFERFGTIQPTKDEVNSISTTYMAGNRVHGYKDTVSSQSTMAINALHILLNESILTGEKICVVVIGSDFYYEKNKSHFYEHNSEIPHSVKEGVGRHRPDLEGVAADPLRFGEEWLVKELQHVKERYENNGALLYRDTPSHNTLLPFKKYPLADIYTAIDKNLIDYVEHLFYSVEENSSIGCRYHIVVPEAEVGLFEERYPNFHIHGISAEEFNDCDTGRFGTGMYLRYYIPDIQKRGNAIYFDTDVIVTGDVRELWSMDLGLSDLAAVPSCFRKKLGIPEQFPQEVPVKLIEWDVHGASIPCPKKYKKHDVFFSGQLVFNCEAAQKSNLVTRIAEAAKEYGVYDMAAAIIAVNNNWVPMDKEWYCAGYILGYGTGQLVGNMSYMIKEQNYGAPKLIHWNGKAKPWLQKHNTQGCYYTDMFWYYHHKGESYAFELGVMESGNNCTDSTAHRVMNRWRPVIDVAGNLSDARNSLINYLIEPCVEIVKLTEKYDITKIRLSSLDRLTTEVSRVIGRNAVCWTSVAQTLDDQKNLLVASIVAYKCRDLYGCISLYKAALVAGNVQNEVAKASYAAALGRVGKIPPALKIMSELNNKDYALFIGRQVDFHSWSKLWDSLR